jgi:hypothetical protein
MLASRARLLGRVEAWDASGRTAFARACAKRAHGLAAGRRGAEQLLEAIDRMADASQAGPAGHWTAVLAGERATGGRAGPEYDAAFARELAQADWLVSELGIGE